MARLRSPFRFDAFPLVAAVALGACSAQATTDYQGDPLFSMTGRIELQLSATDGSALVPAIAFNAPGEDEVRLIESEVSGEFPASFQVDLYVPPPASVLGGFPSEDMPGEPRHSIGYITAVTAEHPPLLYLASSGGGGHVDCDADSCKQFVEVQNFDATRRGVIELACSSLLTFPDEGADCQVSGRQGDPMLFSWMNDPTFAGAAENYAILYLEAPAAADSYVARRFHAPAGLPAGYHLMRVLPWDRAAEPAQQECRDTAQADAIASYAQAHGVRAVDLDVIVRGCQEPGCELFGPHTRGVRGEWYRLMAERDCVFGRRYEPASPNETISLRLQPGLNFVLATTQL